MLPFGRSLCFAALEVKVVSETDGHPFLETTDSIFWIAFFDSKMGGSGSCSVNSAAERLPEQFH